jgi:hypothetical protein
MKIIFLILILNLTLFGMSATKLQNIDKETLGCIKGIGEKRLGSILEYRKEHKLIKLDDLLNISGIGKKIISNIKNDIKKKSCTINKQKQIKKELKREKRMIRAE